jgi:PAS domain S-box-containing protein
MTSTGTKTVLAEESPTASQTAKELADQKFALDQHAIVAITDVQGTITYVNEKFCAISQYSKEELLGQNHRILNSGHHPKEFFQKMYRTIANGLVWHGEIKNRAKDGSIYWVDTTIVPTLSLEGKPRQYVAIRADITDRKRAEEALKESLAMSDRALKELADQKFALDQHAIVAVTDVQGTITYVNEKFCAISQYPKEELIGQNHRILNSGYHPKEFFQQMYRTIAGGQVWHGEIKNRAKDGSYYWVDTTIVPFMTANGRPRQYVAIRADITERKRAEEAAKESLAARVEAVKELADQKFALDQHAIVAVTDVQGTITYVNDKFCAISQYSKEELIGQNHRILNSGHHSKEFFQQMYHTIANGEVWHKEIQNRAKDGSIYWVDTTVVPFLGADGKPRQYVAIRADITERKRAEEVRERLAAVVESSDDAILGKTLEGTITAWNRGAEKVFGYSATEAVGQAMAILIPPERAQEETDILARIKRGESVEHFETIRVRKDGKRIEISATISPIKDSSGRVVGASKIARDVTERKLGEAALKESFATSEAALKEIADQKFALDQHAIVAITDVQGTITYVNDKFCSISQYSKDELIGQNHRILNSGHHPQEFFQKMYHAIANGQVWHGEIKNRAKDGSNYWVDTTVVPALSKEGKPRQYVAIRADITERKRAEGEIRRLSKEMERRNVALETQAAELQRTRDALEVRVQERTEQLANANQVLEQSNIELQQFAYIASHDLQSPLRSISGFVHLLKSEYDGKLDEQADDWIRRTVTAIQQMQTLIRDLLSYSRVDSRSRPFVLTPLSSIFNEAVVLLESSIQDSRGQVTHGELPTVMGDRSQLLQLMQNLIGNALKYHGEKPPHVHVSGERNGEEWTCTVQDNGIGIEPRYYERIFEIFKRLHDQKEYPGTGIGLAVCRRVVSRHGGRIWVESEPGQGSAFHFTIPEGHTNNDQQTQQ